MSSEKKKIRFPKHPLRVSAGLMVALGSLGYTGNWWRLATDNLSNMNISHPEDVMVDMSSLTPVEVAKRSEEIKNYFLTATLNSIRQQGRIPSPRELAFANGALENYELLGESSTSSGFFGTAWRDKETGEVVLSLGGADADWRSPIKFLQDLDDIIMSPTGAKISQLDDAIAFAEKIKQQAGKIDFVSGHSLGGYLALYLTGAGICGDAKCCTFDGTGVSRNMIATCARMGKKTREEVTERFKTLCTSVTIMRNGFNCMGTQPGEYFTFTNDINCRPFYPKKHFYPDFMTAFSNGDPLILGKTLGTSYEAQIATLAMLAISSSAIASLLFASRRDKQKNLVESEQNPEWRQKVTPPEANPSLSPER